MNYSGIDLHSNNSVVTITDDTDRVVAEKRLPNDLAKIIDFLLPWREALVGVVVESTYNWYWLVDGLQAAGFIVHLASLSEILCVRHNMSKRRSVYAKQDEQEGGSGKAAEDSQGIH